MIMFYEESQLDKLLYCSRCREKFDEPRVLPCGNLICQRCIQDIQNLVGILDDPEFHCQICTHFHDFPKNKSFPLCQQVYEFLSIKPNEKPRSHIHIALRSLEKRLDRFNQDVNSLEMSEYLSKLQAHVISTTDETIEKMTELKESIISDLSSYQMKHLELNKQLERFNSDSKLKEIKRIHSELKTNINMMTLSQRDFNDVNILINEVKEVVEREKKRYDEFVCNSGVLEHGKSLVEIDRELHNLDFIQVNKFNENE